jgi:hypothetical protein
VVSRTSTDEVRSGGWTGKGMTSLPMRGSEEAKILKCLSSQASPVAAARRPGCSGKERVSPRRRVTGGSVADPGRGIAGARQWRPSTTR